MNGRNQRQHFPRPANTNHRDKGYSEYLDRNIGKDILTADGTREIAGYIHEAASRLEDYANSVHEVQALEDMSLDYKEIALPDLMKEMQTQLSILSEHHQTNIHISAHLPEQTVSLPLPPLCFGL